MKTLRIFGMALAAVVMAGMAGADEAPLAFPGAEGFGAHAQGGRGGRVFTVTTLEDYHPGAGAREASVRKKTGEIILPAQPAVPPETPIPGSLRAAVDAEGPRMVVFAVAGTIALKAPLSIRHPFITIAGQSAPGGGVCLKNYGLLMDDTHDVIVRHLRVRPGDETRREVDGMSVGKCRRVMVDHCSAGWAVDENLSVSGAGGTDITVQWCFITESLNDSVHSKGDHGMGSLIRSDGDVSFHHNLYAMNNTRNPRPGTYGDPRGIRLDFRNNVVYNWGSGAGYSAQDPANINYVANWIEPGPAVKYARRVAFTVGGETTRIYAADNRLRDGETVLTDDWAMVDKWAAVNRLDAPLPVRDTATEPAEAAREAILAHGGASKPVRDAVDARVVSLVRTGAGCIINSQRDVGGWPELAPGVSPPDGDGDGMPDAWETAHSLDPKNAADGAAVDLVTGYTALEAYLNALAGPAAD